MTEILPCPPPQSLWQAETVRIVSIKQELADTRTYDLQFVNAHRKSFDFQPGQFNMLYLPGAGEAAISMSGASQADGVIRHTVRTVGNVTGELARLNLGETFGLRGPFGRGWPLDRLRGRDVILIAGGIGLAPLWPVIYAILSNRDAFGEVTLLFGARSPDQLLYAEEFADWRQGGMRVEVTVDRPDPNWSGQVGVVTLLLDRLPITDPLSTQVLLCGPEVMMKYAALAAERRRIPSDHLWVSLERNMNFAVGFCGHCQLGPEFLCKDGPVFPFPRVRGLMEVKEL